MYDLGCITTFCQKMSPSIGFFGRMSGLRFFQGSAEIFFFLEILILCEKSSLKRP